MKIIAIDDDSSIMYFCGFAVDEQSVDKEVLPHLCYNYDCLAVKKYDCEEDLLVDLVALQKTGINAFAMDTKKPHI